VATETHPPSKMTKEDIEAMEKAMMTDGDVDELDILS
jgi:hypothetical protein